MVNYIPVLTTIFSIFFLSRLIPHYLAKGRPNYLLWWLLGVATFGMGTVTESINAIFGWSEANTKIWYIVGALLGGYPLAQGTIYLLMNKRFADISTVICSAVIVIAGICVLLSPIQIPPGFDYRLTGRVLEWQWVRLFSPFINIYAFIFLFGGAVYSAHKYFYGNNVKTWSFNRSDRIFTLHNAVLCLKVAAFYLKVVVVDVFAAVADAVINYFQNEKINTRFLGNIFIAIGALLPGIGGTATRFGHVEVLYITELVGLVFIYLGYHIMRMDQSSSVHANQRAVEADQAHVGT